MHNTSLRTQVIWSCVAAVLIGFFLPWASAEFREPKLLGKISSGMKRSLNQSAGRQTRKARPLPKNRGTATIPTRVSGFQVPILANRQNAQVAMSLIELFTKKQEHLGAKSWAVYAIPGLALLAGWLLTAHGRRRPVMLLVGALCSALAATGFWKVLTVDTKSMFAIAIGPGIWITLWAYAGLAAVALSDVRFGVKRA